MRGQCLETFDDTRGPGSTKFEMRIAPAIRSAGGLTGHRMAPSRLGGLSGGAEPAWPGTRAKVTEPIFTLKFGLAVSANFRSTVLKDSTD